MAISKISIKSIKQLFLGKNSAVAIFIVMLLGLLLGEAWVVKKSAALVMKINSTAREVVSSPGVRVDFKAYDDAVARLTEYKTFKTTPFASSSPFGTQAK